MSSGASWTTCWWTPGTSDEHISIVQYLSKALGPSDGAVIVSTPQEVSLMDVRKELSFCAMTKLRVLGVIENMAGMLTPLPKLTLHDAQGRDVSAQSMALLRERCPELLELFSYADVFPSAGGGAEAMAAAFGVPFFGRVPLDPDIVRACEAGTSYTAGMQLRGARSLLQPIVEQLIEATTSNAPPPLANDS